MGVTSSKVEVCNIPTCFTGARYVETLLQSRTIVNGVMVTSIEPF